MALQKPGELAAVLRRAAVRVVPDLEQTIELTLHRALEICHEVIGHEGAAPPDWPPFAESTESDPRRFGPLERTGELRASLRVEVRGLIGALVSSSPHMIYSEFGTAHEPPRPLLTWAVRKAMREVAIHRLRFTLTRVLT